MTTALYVLAVLTPLVISGVSLAMIWVRWIERRVEDRVRAEHGLPPRAPSPARPLEGDVVGAAPVQALRRRVAVAFEPDVAAPWEPPASAPSHPRTPAPPSQFAAKQLPWPLDDLGVAEEPEIRVSRPPAEVEPVAPPPLVPESPQRDAEGARAALARAAATLDELERVADQADRYGTKGCPECGRSVRLSARVCPHCRHRMAPEPGRRDVTAA